MYEKELEKFHNRLVGSGVTKKTIDNYEQIVKDFLSYTKQPLNKIRVEDLDTIFAQKLKKQAKTEQESPNRGRGIAPKTKKIGEYSNSTKRLYFTALKRFFEIMELNLANEIIQPKRQRSSRMILEQSEVEKNISYEKIVEYYKETKKNKHWNFYSLRDWCLLTLILDAGARIGECQKLLRTNLKLERIIPVVELESKGGFRTIPVSKKWMAIFEDYNRLRPDSPNVFCSHAGSSLLTKTLEILIHRHTGFYPHKFRHYYSIRFLEINKNINALKRNLGHASLETTAVYLEYIKSDEDVFESPLEELK